MQDASFKFSLIQQILSDYLNRRIDPLNFDELSMEATSLLHSLMNFGFYSNTKQLQDILVPLIRILDVYTKPENRKSTSALHNASITKTTPLGYLYMTAMRVALSAKEKILGACFPGDSPVQPEGFDSDEDDEAALLDNNRDLFTGDNAGESTPLSNLAKKSYVQYRNKKLQERAAQMVKENPKNTKWEKSVLDFLESPIGMLIVLLVVFIAVTEAFLQLYNIAASHTTMHNTLDTFLTIFFIVEFTMKLYCYATVYVNMSIN